MRKYTAILAVLAVAIIVSLWLLSGLLSSPGAQTCC
jgi:hypothetical protein